MNDILINLITIGVPSLVTLITSILDRRFATRSDTRQMIQQMILEDRFYWRAEHKLPLNWTNIQNEYEKYHKFGGNGEITKKVSEYNEWYAGIEKQLREEK